MLSRRVDYREKDYTMSLAVPLALLEQAQRGEVDDAAFLDCVRTSLPYAWEVIAGLIADLEAGRRTSSPTTRCPRRTRRPAGSCCG